MNQQIAIFKLNNGNGALLCSNCSVIIKTGREFDIIEMAAMRGEINMFPQYCSKCIDLVNEAKMYAKIDPDVNVNSYEERYYNNNVDKYDAYIAGANSEFVYKQQLHSQIQILEYILLNNKNSKDNIRNLIKELQKNI